MENVEPIESLLDTKEHLQNLVIQLLQERREKEERDKLIEEQVRRVADMLDAMGRGIEKRETTWRDVAQAVWHGITLAKSEIWKLMGWK